MEVQLACRSFGGLEGVLLGLVVRAPKLVSCRHCYFGLSGVFAVLTAFPLVKKLSASFDD
jgi:hypothetical protein